MGDNLLTDRQTDRQYFHQFQGLRAIAFIAIYISHLGVIPRVGALGPWGVSIFLILSGFLMVHSYWLKECSPKCGIAFAFQKVRRLYPLHIVTMLLSAGMEMSTIARENGDAMKLLVDIVLHSALVQIWIPNSRYYATLNGVAWYLCACAFAYCLFPLVLRQLKRVHNETNVRNGLIALFFVQILIAALAFAFGNPDKKAFLSAQWITYYCPLSRFVDFCIGCCLGYLYIHRTELHEMRKHTNFATVVAVVLVLLEWCAFVYQVPLFGSEYVRYTILFSGTSALLIWLIAVNKGFITKVLSNAVLCWIGNISPYGFLIHYVVIKYCREILEHLPLLNNALMLAMLSTSLTFLGSWIWMKLEHINIPKGRERASR